MKQLVLLVDKAGTLITCAYVPKVAEQNYFHGSSFFNYGIKEKVLLTI